jgi:hypothetical protein
LDIRIDAQLFLTFNSPLIQYEGIIPKYEVVFERLLTTHPGKSPDTLCLLPLNGVFEQNLVRSTVSRRATIQPGPTRQTRRATLLDHVGQLVCHQAPAPLRSRRVLTSPERNVAAHRVRPCAQLCRRLRGGIIGVKAHAAEIDAKPRLEELPFRGRQRTAAALQLANAPL